MFRASKFVPYQEIKIQETSDQIPVGNIPRTFSVVAKGEVTRRCTPGDIAVITGVFVPAQFESTRGINTKLIHDTYVEAFNIAREKKRYVETVLDPETEELIRRAREDDVYAKLARSIAPEIYGLEDVKKALLLLMVGGSTQNMNDGMKIRGDINIALIVNSSLVNFSNPNREIQVLLRVSFLSKLPKWFLVVSTLLVKEVPESVLPPLSSGTLPQVY